MTLEALPSNELPAFLIYDTVNAAAAAASSCLLFDGRGGVVEESPMIAADEAAAAGEGRRKRRRRAGSEKNKEDAESQRMTHIAVERNRRRLMNEHLAVLRSLTPESYVHKGDQASVVGGAIDFVKELEQLLQSLEAQKRTLLQQQQQQQQQQQKGNNNSNSDIFPTACYYEKEYSPPFAQFFSYPQYAWCHPPRDYPSPEIQHRPATLAPSVADVEVNLIETHANIRVLTARRPGQLVEMVAGIQSLRLTILHLNVTALDAIVLYSFSVKVEEGCGVATADDIAAAVHHILSLVEA